MDNFIKWPDEAYDELVGKVLKKEQSKLDEALKNSIQNEHEKILKQKAKSKMLKELYLTDALTKSLKKYDKLPPVFIPPIDLTTANFSQDPKAPDNRKVIHWTGNTETYSCQACGKPRLTDSTDVWLVMKKTWLTHDPNFLKCVEVEVAWDIKKGPLIFIGAPAINPMVDLVSIRNDLLDAIRHSLIISNVSRILVNILSSLENSTGGLTISTYDDIKLSVPNLLKQITKTAPCRPYLLKILKAAYLNSY